MAFNEPSNLQGWRERLFHVTETIVLTEEEWNMYRPPIDNVWSHRSTQTSKNVLVRTHYYYCRLKGRPPGVTPSVQNPDRKKRKRVARARDLCHTKIGISESSSFGNPKSSKVYTIERVRRKAFHRPTPEGGYIVEKLDRGELMEQFLRRQIGGGGSGSGSGDQSRHHQQRLEEGVNSMSMDVDGSGPDDSHDRFSPDEMAVTSRGDNGGGSVGSELLADLDSYGVPGLLGEVHRHTLEQSDAIKTSSYQREQLRRKRKELKKAQVSLFMKHLFHYLP